MIKIENVEIMGWEHVIRGMRNPMNSCVSGRSNDFCDGELYCHGRHEWK